MYCINTGPTKEMENGIIFQCLGICTCHAGYSYLICVFAPFYLYIYILQLYGLMTNVPVSLIRI
jgi:hypothetical protein